jgi:hypothetical protein
VVKQLEYTPGRRSLQEGYFGICGILLLSEPLFISWLVAAILALTMGYAAPPARVPAHNGPAGVVAGEQLRHSEAIHESTIEAPHAAMALRANPAYRDRVEDSSASGPALFQPPPPALF